MPPHSPYLKTPTPAFLLHISSPEAISSRALFWSKNGQTGPAVAPTCRRHHAANTMSSKTQLHLNVVNIMAIINHGAVGRGRSEIDKKTGAHVRGHEEGWNPRKRRGLPRPNHAVLRRAIAHRAASRPKRQRKAGGRRKECIPTCLAVKMIGAQKANEAENVEGAHGA